MTNKEKARLISEQFHCDDVAYDAAEQMAEWKDEQYAKALAPILIELDELKHQVKSLLP